MEKGNETIPSNLRETLEKGPLDDEDNDAYAERYGWRVERSYSRPVLVIWPELREHEVRREDDDLVYNTFLTVEGIKADSTGPKPLEEQSVEFLLDALQASEPGLTFEEVARVICPAASAWKNGNLWIRFFEICRGQSCSEILKAEFIDQGLLELGEDVVLPSLEDLFDHGPGQTDTLEFLDRLEAESEEVPAEWISVQRQRALSGPGSLTADRITAMIDASESLHSLRAIMISVIASAQDSVSVTDLLGFAIAIFNKQSAIEDDDDEPEEPSVPEALADLFSTAIEKALEELSPSHAYDIITGLIKTDNCSLLPSITEQLVEPSAQHVLVPLIRRLHSSATLRASPEATRLLKDVYVVGLPLLIGSFDKDQVTEKDLEMIVYPVIQAESVKLLENVIIPKTCRTADKTAFCLGFLQTLSRRVRTAESQSGVRLALETSIMVLSEELIRQLDTMTTTAQDALTLFQLLLEAKEQKFVNDLLARLTDPDGFAPSRLDKVLLPFVSGMIKALRSMHLGPFAEPYAAIIKSVVLAWSRQVLGSQPQPGSEPRRISCPKGCWLCEQFSTFLVGVEHEKVFAATGALDILHLKQQLRNGGAEAFCTWNTLSTVPLGLWVTKKTAARPLAEWKAQRTRGLCCLRSISEIEVDLRRLLGAEDYLELLGRMDVVTLCSTLKERAAAKTSPAAEDNRRKKRARIV